MSDLISRQQVLALAKDVVLQNGAKHKCIDATQIWELPSLEPEREKGKWQLADVQRKEDIDNNNYLYFCSNCFHSDIHSKSVKVPYCWFCGCMMEVQDE